MVSIQDLSKTSNDEEDCMFAMQLMTSIVMPNVMPKAMQIVLKLHVVEIIARAGKDAHHSPAEIVSHLPTQNPEAPAMHDHLLRLLPNYSILSCSTVVHGGGNVERLYGLAPVCKYFVPDEDGISFSPWMTIPQEDARIRAWSGMKDAILGGGNPC